MIHSTQLHKRDQVSLLTLSMGVILSFTVFASASAIPIANTLKTWLDYLIGLSYFVVGIGIIFTVYSYFSGRFNWVTGIVIVIIGAVISNLYTILDLIGMSVGCVC